MQGWFSRLASVFVFSFLIMLFLEIFRGGSVGAFVKGDQSACVFFHCAIISAL